MRRYELEVNGKSFSITVREFGGGDAVLEIDGTRYTVHVDDIISDTPRPSPIQPRRSLNRDADDAAIGRGPEGRPTGSSGRGAASGAGGAGPTSAGGEDAGSVRAPIPGQVLKLLVKEGDEVTAGKPVLVMEAMKMENVINAPVAGRVERIVAREGDAVTQGQELMVIG